MSGVVQTLTVKTRRGCPSSTPRDPQPPCQHCLGLSNTVGWGRATDRERQRKAPRRGRAVVVGGSGTSKGRAGGP